MEGSRRSRMFPELEDAACRGLDPEAFYAEGGLSVIRAKATCGACAVTEACLEWALQREEFGVWGGTTAKERAAIRRARGVRLHPAGVA